MAKKKAQTVSIVIPAYNEEARIGTTMKEVLSWIDQQDLDVDIIVIDDGSKDQTVEKARQIADKRVSVVSYHPNQGKGFAIKTGVKHATKDLVLFLDADHSIPISHLNEFISQLKDAQVVIGSKALKSTEKIKKQKPHREILGRCFNLLVRIITGLRFKDTQCGFKLFTKEAAKRIFANVRVRRFSFDVEALYLAKKFGFKVKEMPITLTERETSRVSIVFDSLSMLKDVLLIRLRDIAGLYERR
ncbi:MAG TPA: dolichyl-phosphate beta-glucosyltransferase [Candidatus Nanoarchaeia archaeon]|nr:dolichyl-phosphate beta-glucosyltransferase [Candidatus Nanoarchaeia archaeon]